MKFFENLLMSFYSKFFMKPVAWEEAISLVHKLNNSFMEGMKSRVDFELLMKGSLEDIAFKSFVFLKQSNDTATLIHKIYYREDGEWVEQIIPRKLLFDTIPEWAKEKLVVFVNDEVDITKELEAELNYGG